MITLQNISRDSVIESVRPIVSRLYGQRVYSVNPLSGETETAIDVTADTFASANAAEVLYFLAEPFTVAATLSNEEKDLLAEKANILSLLG